MAEFFQITQSKLISAISSAIYDVFGDSLYIYTEKQENIKLPAVTIYCINYEKARERSDRFVNTFDVIINYFPEDIIIINNKRADMSEAIEKIMDAIKYIPLPAYIKNSDGNLMETTLPNKCANLVCEEKEGYAQINTKYIVRTKQYTDNIKMNRLDLDITNIQ